MKIITDDGQEFTVEHVKTADLSPGDVVIFKLPRVCSDEVLDRIKHYMQPYFPDQKILVLTDDLDIEILRQKAKEAGGGYWMTLEQAERMGLVDAK